MKKKYFKFLSSFLLSFLKIWQIRALVGLIRFFFFRIFRGVKYINSSLSREDTVTWNLTAFKNIITYFKMNRIQYLYGPISGIDRVNKNSEILLIGSRTENEILYLKAFGHKKINAADLISYSPDISIQDMHDLKFDSNKFDLIILGWVMVYSKDLNTCVKNIIRVAKDNAIIAIAYAKEQKKEFDFNINSLKEIHDLFKDYINRIYFQYDGELSELPQDEIQKISSFRTSHIVTVFSIKK